MTEPDNSTTNNPATDVIAELVSEVKALRARVSELGKGQAALKHRLRESETPAPQEPGANGHSNGAIGEAKPASPPSSVVQGTLTYKDLSSVIALERAKAALSQPARERIERLQAAGVPNGELLETVRLLATPATPTPDTPSATPASRTLERPASPPARTSAQHPRSLPEYYRLARENPEAKKQLDRDPTFHPEDLPLRE